MHIDVADDALLVDDEQGAFALAIGTQDAELLSHPAVRPEVAEQRIGDAAQAFAPCPQAIFAVYAQTQNLGLDPIKPV